MDKTYFISKKRHDTSTSGCTNRLLTMILILLSVQTLMFLVLAISIYSAYENHREDLHAIGDVPWGKMAHDFHNQYKRVNPTDISAILTNARNMTTHGNNLLHRHIENILVDTEKVVGEAEDNKDIFTQARGIMFKVRKPVDNLGKLISDDAVLDIHETIKLLKDISEKIDDMDIKHLGEQILSALKRLLSRVTPAQLKQIHRTLGNLNNIMNASNVEVLTTVLKDADEGYRNVRDFMGLFKKTK